MLSRLSVRGGRLSRSVRRPREHACGSAAGGACPGPMPLCADAPATATDRSHATDTEICVYRQGASEYICTFEVRHGARSSTGRRLFELRVSLCATIHQANFALDTSLGCVGVLAEVVGVTSLPVSMNGVGVRGDISEPGPGRPELTGLPGGRGVCLIYRSSKPN